MESFARRVRSGFGLTAILFLGSTIAGCVGPKPAAGQILDPTTIVPTLQYNWETGGVGEVFRGTVKTETDNPYPSQNHFKVIVVHVPVHQGSDLRVEFFEDIYPTEQDYGQSDYLGRLAEVVSRNPAPKNWLGIRLANNVIFVDVCEHYDAGCPTSVQTTLKPGPYIDLSDSYRFAKRARHKGPPQGANWIAVAPSPQPLPSLGPGVVPVWKYNSETRSFGENFKENDYLELIVVHRPVAVGSDLFLQAFSTSDPDHPRPVEYLGTLAELRSQEKTPRNWLSAHFSDHPSRTYVDVCEQYDQGCPTSILKAYGGFKVETVTGESYPYASAVRGYVMVSQWHHSGRPEGANWIALTPTPSPKPTPTPTPGPGSAGHIVGGVNFDEMTYTEGPCSGVSHMHLGKYDDPQEDQHADVEDVASGTIGGVLAAVVTLHCSAHAVYDSYEARLYEIAGGAAKQIAAIDGYDAQGGEGFDNGPFPDQWIATSFTGGRLYVDTWQQKKRCDRRHDWLSTTYADRNGKITRIFHEAHHRTGQALYCNPQGRP